jgi:hypothetical protein
MRNALLSLALLAATGCSLMIDPDGVEPKVPTLTAFAVTPSSPWVTVTKTQQLTAIAFYGSSPSDVSSSATWSTSDPSIASVSATGVVTAVAAGSTTISAEFGGRSANAVVTVVAGAVTAIAVTPATSTVPTGATVPLKATATFGASGSADVTEQATWSSSSAAVRVSNFAGSKGVATALEGGSAVVTATFGVSGTASFTVKSVSSIAVAPAAPSVAKGLPQQFTATATYSDNSTETVTSTVSWTSSAASVATIDAAGLASTVGEGTTTIRATLGSVSGSTPLTVGAPALVSISVTPAPLGLPLGDHRQLTATGTYTDASTQNLTTQASWTSSAPTALQVGDLATNKGMVKALKEGGPVNVAAVFGGKTGTCAVTVGPVAVARLDLSILSASDKAPPTSDYGTSIPLTAEPLQAIALVTYSDGRVLDVTQLANWTSTDATRLTVSNVAPTRGALTTKAAGSVTLSASFGGTTTTRALTVRDPIVVFVSAGPGAMNLPVGSTFGQVRATAILDDFTFVDYTSRVTWTSGATNVVDVDPAGKLTPHVPGSALITATAPNGVSGSAPVLVTNDTVVAFWTWPEANVSVYYPWGGNIYGFADYSGGATYDVTAMVAWSSSAAGVMTVAPDGSITPVQTSGTATITGVFDGITVNRTATILGGDGWWVGMSPAPPLPTGKAIQLRAWMENDSGVFEVTKDVIWSSSSPTVASFNNGSDPKGMLRAGATAGMTSVWVQTVSGNQYPSQPVNVVTTLPTSLTLTPSTQVRAPVGGRMKFDATVRYPDNSTATVTDSITLSSDNTTVVAIDTTAPATIKAVVAGNANVTGTLWGLTAAIVPVEVLASPVSSIAISPSPGSKPIGLPMSFTASGTLQNGTTGVDLTRFVTWWSMDESIARQDSDPMSTQPAGTFFGSRVASTQVAAAFGSAIATAQFDVTAAAATGLEIGGAADWANPRWNPVPPPPEYGIYPFQQQQLRAWARLSDVDGTVADVTKLATWTSSAPSVASVSSTGLVTGRAYGTSTITASYGGYSKSVSLNVYSTSATGISSATLASRSAPLGGKTQLVLSGVLVPAGSGAVDITQGATWTSSDPLVASVGNEPGTRGVVTGYYPGGSVTITAAYPGLAQVSTTIAVVAPAVTSISLRAAYWGDQYADPCNRGDYGPRNVPQIFDLQLFACGDFDNGRTYDVTETATWKNGDAAVPAAGTVSDVPGKKGQLQTLAVPGSVVPVASIGAVSGQFYYPLTVGSATLRAVGTDGGPFLARSNGVDFLGIGRIRATGRYSDGNEWDVTHFVTLTEVDPTIVKVGGWYPWGERELVGVSPGWGSIQVDYRGERSIERVKVAGDAYLSVRMGFGSLPFSAWENQGIVNRPTSWPTLPVGVTLKPWLLGYDVIGLPWKVEEQATWASSNPAVASVSSAAGSRGVVLGRAPGFATITATVNGLTASAEVEVNAATLTSFAVSPTYDVAPVGAMVGPFEAIAAYSDGTSIDVSDQVTWPPAMIANRDATPGRYAIITSGINSLTVTHNGGSAAFRIAGF